MPSRTADATNQNNPTEVIMAKESISKIPSLLKDLEEHGIILNNLMVSVTMVVTAMKWAMLEIEKESKVVTKRNDRHEI
ncbi:MAG: hypothetical protein WCG04_03755 [Alphaproteobacteria bacterium]